MRRIIENEDKVLMENASFIGDNFAVHGYYGLDFFNIVDNRIDECITCDNKEEFLELYNLMTEMKKEIDRLENL